MKLVSDVKKALAKAARTQKYRLKRMEQELHLIGEEIMTEAKEETPVDTGLLRSTGMVESKVHREGPAVELSFNTSYAGAVHEDLTAFHPVGNAKYLEGPVRRAEPDIPERLIRRAK